MGMKRVFVEIEGLVEGVGFRPFVYRIAKEIGVSGWVKNDSRGVYVEVEGDENKINKFLNALYSSYPKAGEIFSIATKELPVKGDIDFVILPSTKSKEKFPVIPPDIAICDNCKNELLSQDNKRFFYPFINCTDCGPRFSIVEDVPYDRVNTSMRYFEMCDFCRNEYEDVVNRRFHAQPVACFECGPWLELFDSSMNKVSKDYPKAEGERREYTISLIKEVAKIVNEGKIVALKGIGGFQLICRADDDNVVLELRKRKRRDEKPFALMFRSIDDIEKYCYLSEREKKYLTSYISPIVLLKKKENTRISKFVSPRNPFIGCMLPYSPLHILLMEEIKLPIICTSANLSDEPICIDNNEAFERLKGIADYFLVHNRKIVRHVDDSVVKITPFGNEIIIRRARGFVPKPIVLGRKLPPILAVGGHLKNTIAVSVDNYVILSQHIGDLETFESIKAFERSIYDFLKFYDIKPKYIVSDLHPDYISTQFAEKFSEEKGIEHIKVQHHFSHILSVMAENNILDEDVIGVGWDGTGYGVDGEIWGSEFMFVSNGSFERMYHFLPIPLIGGEKAIKEVYRIGIGLLLLSSLTDEAKKIFGNEENFKQITEMFYKRLYVKSSGAGRLFDGVSSIIGVSRYSNFEGQSAMELEFLTYFSSDKVEDTYEYEVSKDIIDWRKIIVGITEDIRKQVPPEIISVKFHNTIVRIIFDCVVKISGLKRCNKVVLSGGVFQNGFILDNIIELLTYNGFEVFINRKVPPNDGGISLGQVVYPYFKFKLPSRGE